MRKQIDLCGLTCPEPVLRTKRLLDDKDIEAVEAVIDDEVCLNNLRRLARSTKATITATALTHGFKVVIEKTSTPQQIVGESRQLETKTASRGGSVIFLPKDTFGQGDPEFSRTLLNLFLQTVQESGQEPQAILMANSGVKLMSFDSPVKTVLDDFKAQGCTVLACGLCVEFYGLAGQVPKDQITNMFAISEYLFASERVITP